MPDSIRLLAPAKINLFLRVLRRRPDGYHDIYSVFQKVTFCDEITLSASKKDIELEVSGPVSVPVEGNLCLKAARLFFEKASLKAGVYLRLHKNIPPGSGLGGGSSDAAAVLRGLNELYQALKEEELISLGPKLGADVPFFLSSYSTALAQGIGERLSPWPTHRAWYLLLLPPIEISTAWAYRNLRLTTPRKPPNYVPDQPLWRQGLVNDFEPVVFSKYPVLKEFKERLLERGAEAALLTGSGAALFGVFEQREKAQEAARFFEEKGVPLKIVTNYP